MKLSIDTYVICGEWPLDKIIAVCRAAGYAGVEFRAESGQQHGVELEASPETRREIRRRLEDAYLETSCISTSQCLHQTDTSRLQEHVERAKRYVDLAADLDCAGIRVFGDGDPITPEMDSRDALRRTGDALRDVAEHASGSPVTVLFEMHGQFNHWQYALGVINHADHPHAGINYNCDRRDLVAGSVRETYSRIAKHLRHVHMHNLESWEGEGAYPYVQLFRLLKEDGYERHCSLEVGYRGGDPETVMALYAALWRAQVTLAGSR